jgi:amidase
MITAGSTLWLPVNVPGALFGLGDLHAAMGDGEVSVCGLEIPGEVLVELTVVKNRRCRCRCSKTARPCLPSPRR